MVGSDPVRDLEFSPDAHVLAVLSPAALFFSAWAAACSLARAPGRRRFRVTPRRRFLTKCERTDINQGAKKESARCADTSSLGLPVSA